MRVDVKWRREGDVAVASILGRLDGSGSDTFLALVEKGLNSGDRALLLDFADVTFISSAGLRVCLVLAKRFSGSGKGIAMSSLSVEQREVIAVSGFDRLVPVHDAPDDALAELRNV